MVMVLGRYISSVMLGLLVLLESTDGINWHPAAVDRSKTLRQIEVRSASVRVFH